LLDFYSNSESFSKIDSTGDVNEVFSSLEQVVQG